MDPLDEKARRVRSLLSSYYGGEEASVADSISSENSQETSASRITGARASGIDSATFDPDRYIRSLLKGARLDSLMSKHVEMANEIKSLDSDMQMLVYENYNKFISATDTIRKMKSNVDGMGSNMEELMDTIDSVADRSNAVNAKLQQRRDHIEELNRVRSLLKKMQAMFNLPRKLRAALDNDALEVAVEHYASARPVLERFGQQGAFRSVAAETTELSHEVVAALKKRLLSRKDDVAECIKLLSTMGQPIESLQEDFLDCRRIRLEAILRQAQAVVAGMCSTAGMQPPDLLPESELVAMEEPWGCLQDGGGPPALGQFVAELNSRFLGDVVQMVSSFEELFPEGRRRLIEVLKEACSKYFSVVRTAIAASAAVLANAAAGLSDAACDAETELPGPLGDNWGGPAIAGALSTIKADFSRLGGVLPELALGDRASEVVESAVRHHVGVCFRALELRVIGEVRAAYVKIEGGGSSNAGVSSPEQKYLRSRVLLQSQARIAGLLQEAPSRVLAGMRQLLDEGARLLDSWRDMYVDLVAGSLQNLFLALLAHFRAISGTSAPDGSTAQPIRYGTFGSNLLFPTTPRSVDTPTALSRTSVSLFSPLNLSLSFSAAEGASPAHLGTASEPAPPSVVLLLACLCTHIEANVIQLCMEQLASRFPGGGGGGGGDQPPAFVAGASSPAASQPPHRTSSPRMWNRMGGSCP
uniref:Vacuolar protein sorting-associated protein 51 homolog n=1 Tax=Tetraselmis sp. GSL018 TaxID=582737 RepID=A0A061QG84_9CHLO